LSKASFTVKVARKGREKDYYDFWLKEVLINDAGEQLDSSVVGFVEIVDANNKAEAISLVRKMHPELHIDTEATERHG
jgi:hypothetical protein